MCHSFKNCSRSISGGITENFEFQLDDDTQVYRSCSATLNGELFVFGGAATNKNQKRQVNTQNLDLLSHTHLAFQGGGLWIETYWRLEL